jgi:hypothetical protein
MELEEAPEVDIKVIHLKPVGVAEDMMANIEVEVGHHKEDKEVIGAVEVGRHKVDKEAIEAAEVGQGVVLRSNLSVSISHNR